jgi:hypothetical protein
MATKNNKNQSNRPSNYVIFTLMAVAAGEVKYSKAGKPFATVRAFLSQGKDKQTEEYKPSVFFDVKGFSDTEDITALVQSLGEIANKDRFTVKGRMGLEEWIGKDEVKRQQLVIFAKSIEPFNFEVEETVDEEELEGEPA